ncbi:MAG TPA: FHA domain-containing protein [Anaerolineales bacterium]|nr:FHA domain-containing protein [Anaerolineales bacterium]
MPGPQYRLVVRQGPTAGQIFELNKSEITIGRDISNDFVINDSEVSRKHAKLSLEGERYKIEDLNSTNGTYIDGQRLIGPHLLAIGEVIMFGDNVGVIFDGEPGMPDITVPGTLELGRTPVAAIPTPVESFVPPVAPPSPTASLIPEPQAAILEPEVEAELPVEVARKPVNTWLLAGLGCLLVIVVLLIALFVFIDQPWKPGGGLYCVSPFDIIFRSLGFCR